jgi:hypothetical protein
MEVPRGAPRLALSVRELGGTSGYLATLLHGLLHAEGAFDSSSGFVLKLRRYVAVGRLRDPG